MEKAVDWEQMTLINELKQGKELAKQLSNHLKPSSPLEKRQFLIEKILYSYEKALSMLNSAVVADEVKPVLEATNNSTFANCSPTSAVSDQDSKDQYSQKDVFKKRKTQPKWTEQVKVCSGSGLEGPLDDGYSWRKYGQKDILGANFPRGYYRCTHRHSQGCLATKQVQKSDSDPSVFEVTYRGRHTCIQASHSSKKQLLCQHQQKQGQEKSKPSNTNVVFNFQEELTVKTENLEFDKTRGEIFRSFSFKFGNEDEGFNTMMENNFLATLSPAFISPATSESNYFAVSPCDVNNFGLGHGVHTSESELTEVISAPTSVNNSPMADLDISIENVNFDAHFPFDNPKFFA